MEIGGINSEQIVTSLMQIEERPLIALQARQDAARTAVSAIGRVKTAVESFRLGASRLSDPGSFSRFSTTVSQPDALGASVSGTAFPSSLSFAVSQLARSHGMRSIGTVSASSIPITADAVLSFASGTLKIGVASVEAGAGLPAGTTALEVVQASAAAATVGTSPLAASTVVDSTNNTLAVSVHGVSHDLVLAEGTYDPAGLTQAVQNALDSAGAPASASLDGSGALVLATSREGSAATLQVMPQSPGQGQGQGQNTSLAMLGLSGDANARSGTDGIFDVGGTITTVTQAEAGQTVAVDTGAGTLDVVLSGGMRVGSSNVTTVSTGDRSLASVAAAINDAGGGISAAAVRVSDDSWRLQLSSRTTGVDSHIAISSSALSGIGGLVESSAAQNARITIGEGAGVYDVEASGNTFIDVLPGVTLTAKAVTANPVTVGVTRNDDAIAADVAALISNANSLLAEIKVQTRVDVAAGTRGALAGNSAITSLSAQVRNAVIGEVAGVDGLASTAGIQLTRDGNFTFDRAKFLTAIGENPALVSRLLGRGGTETGDAVFASGTASTVAGTYAVEVTTAATQASSARLFAGGAGEDTRIGVRVGSITATYDVTAGQSAAQIIEGLNNAIAAADIDVVAELDGSGLVIRGNEWGSAGNFELNNDVAGVGTWTNQSGVDVAGTIDGVAATGIGRQLSLNTLLDTPAAGLAIVVAATTPGMVNPVRYEPGIAARVERSMTALTDVDTGLLTTASESVDRRVSDFNDQITRLESRLDIREVNLRRQWGSLQTLLSGLQSQSDWLSGQLATLNSNWAG